MKPVVPFCGGFEQEHDALVGETKLEVTGLADVLQQRLGVIEVEIIIGGEGVIPQLLEEDCDI